MDRASFRYKAFISYAHADEAFVARLHARLERYRIPRHVRDSRNLQHNRLGIIFRDRDELASSASLSGTIRTALADAECLIVVCSPAAAGSRWVDAEIQAFRELRSDGAILPIIADGVAPGPVEALFPGSLGGAEEPLAADARASGDGASRALLKLVSGLIGVGFDELQRRELTRRRRRFAGVAGATAVVLALASFLILQTREAEREAAEQRAQAAALITYMVDDLEERLNDYEEVGELDAGLSQALNYFGAVDAGSMDDEFLEQYRVVLIGVGSVRIRQGKLAEALETFERAAELSRIFIQRAERDARQWYELAQNTYYIGEAYWEMQNVAAAAEKMAASLDHARRAAELEPDNDAYALEVVFGLNNMGAVYTRLKRYPEATSALEGSLEQNRQMRERFPELEEELLNQEVESISWLAEIVPALGDYEKGFEWHERELALRKKLFELTGNIHHQARLSDALGYYAKTLSSVGRTADARAALQEKVAISEHLMREDPDNVFWRTRGFIGKALLAVEVFHSGDVSLAMDLTNQAESGFRDLLAEGLNVEMVVVHLAYLDTNRAYFHFDQPAVALTELTSAFDVLEQSMDDEGINAVSLGYYLRAVILRNALLRRTAGSYDAVRSARALALLDSHGESEQSIYDAASRGLLLLAMGDPAAADILEGVAGRGYRSVFFRSMRAVLAG